MPASPRWWSGGVFVTPPPLWLVRLDGCVQDGVGSCKAAHRAARRQPRPELGPVADSGHCEPRPRFTPGDGPRPGINRSVRFDPGRAWSSMSRRNSRRCRAVIRPGSPRLGPSPRCDHRWLPLPRSWEPGDLRSWGRCARCGLFAVEWHGTIRHFRASRDASSPPDAAKAGVAPPTSAAASPVWTRKGAGRAQPKRS